MLATTKGFCNDGVVVFQSKPNLNNGDEVVITYELAKNEPKKVQTKEWGFMKSSTYFEKNHPGLILSDAVAEERENER